MVPDWIWLLLAGTAAVAIGAALAYALAAGSGRPRTRGDGGGAHGHGRRPTRYELDNTVAWNPWPLLLAFAVVGLLALVVVLGHA